MKKLKSDRKYYIIYFIREIYFSEIFMDTKEQEFFSTHLKVREVYNGVL